MTLVQRLEPGETGNEKLGVDSKSVMMRGKFKVPAWVVMQGDVYLAIGEIGLRKEPNCK